MVCVVGMDSGPEGQLCPCIFKPHGPVPVLAVSRIEESPLRDPRPGKTGYSIRPSEPATGVRTKEAGCPREPRNGLDLMTTRREALNGLS